LIQGKTFYCGHNIQLFISAIKLHHPFTFSLKQANAEKPKRKNKKKKVSVSPCIASLQVIYVSE